ncbi:endo alpha-1,4 polygalactosaminidase [Legionella saoudiensis]|uniref:endo alpha-1,4 polygalactosaminidase n=1 Tax=Legionella saoudiensis TaxID=1750561 RepID=UPI0007315379|nr:endo alpha-1,4 polygalactosaminidase [Legionella saoudiensis]
MNAKLHSIYAIFLLAGYTTYTHADNSFNSVIPAGATWNYVLAETPQLKTSPIAQVYDIDGFDNTANVVDIIHSAGAKVICYISAGTSENWRSDYNKFPSSVQGKNVDGWKGEKWLDVRQLSTLLPIMEARVAMCQSKGFDAVEFDNVDGYTNKTGFNISAQDQINYNIALANLAHKYNLAAALKNDVAQTNQLEESFDLAINEQCYQYDECSSLAPFYKAGKAVLNVEYKKKHINCSDAKKKGISSTYKTLDLDETPFVPCK